MTNQEAIQKILELKNTEYDIKEMYGEALYKAIDALEENEKLRKDIEALKHNIIDMANEKDSAQQLDRQALIEENKQLKAELEQSVKLPCKIGDTVYSPTRDFISEYKVIGFTLANNSLCLVHWVCTKGIYITRTDGFLTEALEKTIFLTREEAEQALAERSNG